jgi:hypothetical protein
LLNEGDISPFQVTTFYKAVRSFYVTAAEYSITNLPLNDDVLENASFLNFQMRKSATFSQVEFFVERFVNNTSGSIQSLYCQ